MCQDRHGESSTFDAGIPTCDNLVEEFWTDGDPAYVVHLITTREDGSDVVDWEVPILISTEGCAHGEGSV